MVIFTAKQDHDSAFSNTKQAKCDRCYEYHSSVVIRLVVVVYQVAKYYAGEDKHPAQGHLALDVMIVLLFLTSCVSLDDFEKHIGLYIAR